jgi:hypothetical protein
LKCIYGYCQIFTGQCSGQGVKLTTHLQLVLRLRICAIYIQNEELRDLYSSPSIIRIIRSRRMKRAGHVAQMGEKRNAYRLLVEKPEGKNC